MFDASHPGANRRTPRRPMQIFWHLLIGCQVAVLASGGVSTATADTNGPPTPATTFDFAANACGPCTDPNTWSLNAALPPNIGNGVCGRCSTVNWTRSSGACAGIQPGPFTCKSGNCKSQATDTFTSTPVGGFAYAGCMAAALVGGILVEVATLLVCAGVCVTAGVVTLGAACVACLTANVGVALAATCAFTDCIENCNFVPARAFGGPAVTCSQ